LAKAAAKVTSSSDVTAVVHSRNRLRTARSLTTARLIAVAADEVRGMLAPDLQASASSSVRCM